MAGILSLAFVMRHVAASGRLGDSAIVAAALLGLALAIAPAWIWWSITVPKWRLWALRYVSNWPMLKRHAIASGLIWPDGSIFARTEIKSAAHAREERALERHWSALLAAAASGEPKA